MNNSIALFSVPERLGDFRWRTMEGDIFTLPQMKTSHIFNSMKMCFNHLADTYGGRPVWFNHVYSDYRAYAESSPGGLAWLVVFFMREIERRGDLPKHMESPYSEIRNQVLGVELLPEESRRFIEEATRAA